MNQTDPIPTPAPAGNPAADAFRASGADEAAAQAAVVAPRARAPEDASAAFSAPAAAPADATKFDESLVAGLPAEAQAAVRENFDANLAAARDAVEGRARARASGTGGRDAIADYTNRLLAEAAAPAPEPAPQPVQSARPFTAARPKPPPPDANGIPDDGLSIFDDFLA